LAFKATADRGALIKVNPSRSLGSEAAVGAGPSVGQSPTLNHRLATMLIRVNARAGRI
jgi:hypothetical protein